MSHNENVVSFDNFTPEPVNTDWTYAFSRYRSNYLNLIPLHLQRVRDDIYDNNYEDLSLFLNIGDLYDDSENCNNCRVRASCFLKCINYFKKTSFCFLCNICHKSFCQYCILDIEFYNDVNPGFKSKACSNCYIFVKEILENKYPSTMVDSASMNLVDLQKRTSKTIATLDTNTNNLTKMYKIYNKTKDSELAKQISSLRDAVLSDIKELNRHRLYAMSMVSIDNASFFNNMKKSYLNYIKLVTQKYVKNAHGILVGLRALEV
ncbi:zinc finger protein, putative [Babesia microti strain RI]|uniref:Zinc finger protein, putative n=1 Tax=Babesia microti (strain RI) TaxID=1133968 RepID=A0A1N6LXJ8_BABMR|nr:zinc finger protein, putative [Babesia microti strain RI]SIO73594.1 zinc finger protein, putative [Babesia microti strain RI]|eukprot:XP_021337679.1 zinc finger protein, putative [Babesia microti strain RI]